MFTPPVMAREGLMDLSMLRRLLALEYHWSLIPCPLCMRSSFAEAKQLSHREPCVGCLATCSGRTVGAKSCLNLSQPPSHFAATRAPILRPHDPVFETHLLIISYLLTLYVFLSEVQVFTGLCCMLMTVSLSHSSWFRIVQLKDTQKIRRVGGLRGRIRRQVRSLKVI